MHPFKAVLFDVLGTTLDWRSSLLAELEALGKKHGVASGTDWGTFAQQWRNDFMKYTQRIASGASGTLNVDVLHRQLLDDLLTSSEWSHIGVKFDGPTREHLVLVWHRLNAWPDAVEGLQAVKKQATIVGLSNGNLRLLVDASKNANLPWDAILSAEFFNTFKPNFKVYLETLHHLSLPPENCVMVSSHMWELRAASSLGITAIYVPRPNEDLDEQGQEILVKSKAEEGEVDYVVDSFTKLSEIIAINNAMFPE